MIAVVMFTQWFSKFSSEFMPITKTTAVFQVPLKTDSACLFRFSNTSWLSFCNGPNQESGTAGVMPPGYSDGNMVLHCNCLTPWCFWDTVELRWAERSEVSVGGCKTTRSQHLAENNERNKLIDHFTDIWIRMQLINCDQSASTNLKHPPNQPTIVLEKTAKHLA